MVVGLTSAIFSVLISFRRPPSRFHTPSSIRISIRSQSLGFCRHWFRQHTMKSSHSTFRLWSPFPWLSCSSRTEKSVFWNQSLPARIQASVHRVTSCPTFVMNFSLLMDVQMYSRIDLWTILWSSFWSCFESKNLQVGDSNNSTNTTL